MDGHGRWCCRDGMGCLGLVGSLKSEGSPTGDGVRQRQIVV